LGGVDAQAIEVEFLDPAGRIGQEEFAYRSAVLAVEVDGVAPFVLVAFAGVVRREPPQGVAAGAEVVVDDVQDDAEAHRVGASYELPQFIGRAVEPRWHEQVPPS
jgi:hypothetical protein